MSTCKSAVMMLLASKEAFIAVLAFAFSVWFIISIFFVDITAHRKQADLPTECSDSGNSDDSDYAGILLTPLAG